MVIKLKKEGSFVYLGGNNILDTKSTERADKLYSEAEIELKNLYEKLNRKNIINPLERWHAIGKLVNKLFKKFNISGKESRYFWKMMYDISKDKTPKHITRYDRHRNDFYLASIIAKHQLNKLKKVGSWSLWREIIGSRRINEDPRVAHWVTNELIKNPNINTRDSARPLLKKVRNRLKNINTEVLTDDEIIEKLKETKN